MLWILIAMRLLVPGANHERWAAALDAVVVREGVIFKDDDGGRRSRAFATAVSFRESSLRPEVVGDCLDPKYSTPGRCRWEGRPTSFCGLQVHLVDAKGNPEGVRTAEGWSGRDLVEDPEKCATVGYRMLRESARACPAAPLAVFARGNCDSAEGRRISADRMALAKRLVAEVKP